MDGNDADSGVPKRDLAGSENESIEDLLRKHGFFDTIQTNNVENNPEQFLPAPDDQLEHLRLLWINVHEAKRPNPIRKFLLQITTKFSQGQGSNNKREKNDTAA